MRGKKSKARRETTSTAARALQRELRASGELAVWVDDPLEPETGLFHVTFEVSSAEARVIATTLAALQECYPDSHDEDDQESDDEDDQESDDEDDQESDDEDDA